MANEDTANKTIAGGYPALSAGFGSGARNLADEWQSPTNALGETFPRLMVNSTTVTLTSGTVRLQSIPLAKGTLVTNIAVITGGTAGVTMTNWWFALTDSGRLVKATSADQLTAAIPLNTVTSLAMQTPYVVPITGLYYIALMVKAATMPSMFGFAGQALPLASTPIISGQSTTGATTPPTVGSTTFAAISATAANQCYAYVT